jgi:hypothetical protein
MTIPADLIESIFERSLREFVEREASALHAGVSERNNCGRLAIYMERIAGESDLKGYFADPEYNRKQGGRVKTFLDDEMQVIEISADLILHSRGANIAEDNLIALEMKKSSRPPKEKKADRQRLRAMTKSSYDGVWSNDGTTHPEHVCGYRLGVYVEINRKARKLRIEYFVRGERTRVRSKAF